MIDWKFNQLKSNSIVVSQKCPELVISVILIRSNSCEKQSTVILIQLTTTIEQKRLKVNLN